MTRPWSLYFYPRLLCVIIILLKHWFQSLAVSAGRGRTWNIIFSKISVQRPETSWCADVMCTTNRSVSDKLVTTTPQSEHVREPFHHKKWKSSFLLCRKFIVYDLPQLLYNCYCVQLTNRAKLSWQLSYQTQKDILKIFDNQYWHNAFKV